MYLCKARPFVVVCFNEFVIDVAEDEVGECSKSSGGCSRSLSSSLSVYGPLILNIMVSTMEDGGHGG